MLRLSPGQCMLAWAVATRAREPSLPGKQWGRGGEREGALTAPASAACRCAMCPAWHPCVRLPSSTWPVASPYTCLSTTQAPWWGGPLCGAMPAGVGLKAPGSAAATGCRAGSGCVLDESIGVGASAASGAMLLRWAGPKQPACSSSSVGFLALADPHSPDPPTCAVLCPGSSTSVAQRWRGWISRLPPTRWARSH